MKLIAIVYKIITFLERLATACKIDRIKKSVNEGLANGDQTEIEKSLGGSAGPSNKPYDGMYERERKER